ncbi:MAG: hypothetical protein AB8G05_19165 [Oligoflexales bacterium]
MIVHLRRFLIVFFCTLFYNSLSFATKSRLESLSQNKIGSFHLDDQRNIFLNPGHLSYKSGYTVFEWGSNGDANNADNFANPKAEGGWFNRDKKTLYGIYLGNEDDRVVSMRRLGNPDFLAPDNTLDIFYGQKSSGSAWGSSVHLSQNKSDIAGGIKKSETTMILKGGFQDKKQQAFAHLIFLDQAKGQGASEDDEYKANIGFTLGGSYSFAKHYKAYGLIESRSAKYTPDSADGIKLSQQTIQLGAVRSLKRRKEQQLHYFLDASLLQISSEIGDTKTSALLMPIVIGAESEVEPWLTLRGSVFQAALINEAKIEPGGGADSTTSSNPNTTNVSAGMSLVYNKVKIDGSFTTTGGQLNAANLMSRVGMIFDF